MRKGKERKQGTLRGWLLSNNLAMLTIVLVLVIILFSAIFSLIDNMQERTNFYQSLNTLSNELTESHLLYQRYVEESRPDKQAQILAEYERLDSDIAASLEKLDIPYEEDPDQYFLHRGIVNGLTFIDHTITQMETIPVHTTRYFGLYYTGDKIYTYLQDYTSNKYLSSAIENDAAWMQTTQENVERYQKLVVFLLVVIATAFCFAIYRMTMRLVKPVDAMVETSEQIANGDFSSPPIPLEGPRELVYLEQSINQMKERLKDRLAMIAENTQLEKLLHAQELEQVKMTRELEKARYKALQSQINPHFLFNTLNTIGRTALFENANSTVDLIDSLASIFRYTLEYHDDVQLSEELSFIRQYLTIQQFRFGARLDYSIVCPEPLETTKIPPLILQPLVENAMVHGLEPKVEGGRIDVKVKQEEDAIVITIEDTGVGIDMSKFRNHRQGAQQHIGIVNIKERISFYFKGKADLSICRTEEAGGTTVTMTIPMKAGNQA